MCYTMLLAAAHIVGGIAADQTADLEPGSLAKHPMAKIKS